jgi:hypothetical protein
VKKVEVAGKKMKPRFAFITYDGWDKERIRDRGYFLVFFDSRGEARFDYYALLRSDGDRVRGALFRDRKVKADYQVASLDAWKPREKKVVVRVPLGKLRLGNKRIFYRWYAETLMTGDNCRQVCIDRVPDEGAIKELLVKPTPEPTPTPDPTPAPSLTPTPEPSPTDDPPGPPGGGGPPGHQPDPSPTP